MWQYVITMNNGKDFKFELNDDIASRKQALDCLRGLREEVLSSRHITFFDREENDIVIFTANIAYIEIAEVPKI